MATITLYSLSKRTNSTKRPVAATPKLTLTGTFNAPYTVISPSIDIEVPAGSDLITDSYNLAYISDTGRYYWINDVVFKNQKIATIRLSEDYLATYKNTIGNSSQFVSRASSVKNGWLGDANYPISNQVVSEDEDISSELPWSTTGKLSDGYYVVGIVNQANDTVGPCSYYVMDQTEFQNFRKVLFSTVSYSNMQFTQIEPQLYKSLWNPMQYITSCYWFPMQPPTSTMDSLTLDIGFFDVNYLSSHIWRLGNSSAVYTSGSLTTVNHPMIADGTYFNAEPFTHRKLIIQPFGEIPLDCSRMMDTNHVLKFKVWVDFITGDAILRAIETTNINGTVVVGEAAGKLGVPIQLSQVTQSPLSIATNSLLGKIGNFSAQISDFMSGGSGQDIIWNGETSAGSELERKFQKTVSRIYNGAAAMGTNYASMGTNGSLLNSIVPALYDTQFCLAPTPNDTVFGAPLCQTKTISTLSGFIKCENARIQVAGAYEPELRSVEAYLNAGFYYE